MDTATKIFRCCKCTSMCCAVPAEGGLATADVTLDTRQISECVELAMFLCSACKTGYNFSAFPILRVGETLQLTRTLSGTNPIDYIDVCVKAVIRSHPYTSEEVLDMVEKMNNFHLRLARMVGTDGALAGKREIRFYGKRVRSASEI